MGRLGITGPRLLLGVVTTAAAGGTETGTGRTASSPPRLTLVTGWPATGGSRIGRTASVSDSAVPKEKGRERTMRRHLLWASVIGVLVAYLSGCAVMATVPPGGVVYEPPSSSRSRQSPCGAGGPGPTTTWNTTMWSSTTM